MSDLKATTIAALVVLALVGGIALEVSLWGECRAGHSWLYCMVVLGHR